MYQLIETHFDPNEKGLVSHVMVTTTKLIDAQGLMMTSLSVAIDELVHARALRLWAEIRCKEETTIRHMTYEVDSHHAKLDGEDGFSLRTWKIEEVPNEENDA